MADGTLVIANGGIQTDPGDRRKLNIETMQPNLCYLSPEGSSWTASPYIRPAPAFDPASGAGAGWPRRPLRHAMGGRPW